VLTPGTILEGRYEILATIAEGGMGTVFRARRVVLGDEVAVKVIRPAGSEAAVLRERFLREARACAQLRHPGIVGILDFSIGPGGEPYLVMELLNGRSLRDELAAAGRLPLPDVQRIAAQVCPAIQLAHDRGVVHRDVKPANIVAHRFETGEVVYKVIDFGLANLREGAAELQRLTTADAFVGTVAYASPEQLQGESIDGRADLYSLGAVVFELLTGRPPFEGPTMLAVITKHLCDDPPRPSRLNPALPPWIDEVVLRALAKRREDRWPGVASFGAALQGAAQPHPTEGPAAGPVPAGVRATYEVGPPIGRGRFGSQVFAGTHRALGVPVAIRLLRRNGRTDWEAVRARFLREARALQVAHPSIIQVRDFGEEADVVYVVTDLIESVSLRQFLAAQGVLPWPLACRLVGQLADAASAVHRRGGFVCGLNPDIIRVTRDEQGERVMISSGGIGHVQDLLSTLSDQTLRGGMLAEPELPYIAPEVFMGRPVDVSADLFTIGVLAFEIVTGARPFEGGSLPELQGAMLAGSVRDPRDARPGLGAEAAAALLRCLSREPASRFESAAAFLRAWPSA